MHVYGIFKVHFFYYCIVLFRTAMCAFPSSIHFWETVEIMGYLLKSWTLLIVPGLLSLQCTSLHCSTHDLCVSIGMLNATINPRHVCEGYGSHSVYLCVCYHANCYIRWKCFVLQFWRHLLMLSFLTHRIYIWSHVWAVHNYMVRTYLTLGSPAWDSIVPVFLTSSLCTW